MSLPVFGVYRAKEELGSGTLSTVYKAVHEPLGRTVALKVLKSTVGPMSPFAAQLEREAHVLAEISHGNVVALYDFVKTDRGMYLVLEHVDGFGLDALLKKQQSKKLRLSYDAIAAIGLQIAEGLAYVHERGVVHRDVKPHNVLVSKKGEVKLCDFGIAQRPRLPSADIPLSPEVTSSKTDPAAFGTPAYMSPEQILGEDVDARSDLFSLGVILYEMVAGTRPFDSAEGKRGAPQRIRRDPPPPLRLRAPDVPRALEALTTRLLEKLPGDRVATAREVATTLEGVIRERSREPAPQVVVRALALAGLVPAKVGAAPPRAVRSRNEDAVRTIGGLFAIGLAFVGAAAAVQVTAPSRANAGAAVGSSLLLLPENVGFVRVVVAPWAEVRVDGQYVDTTPFARPIPVAAGTHWVTLTHPNAPAETREIKVERGESILVDVTLQIEEAPK